MQTRQQAPPPIMPLPQAQQFVSWPTSPLTNHQSHISRVASSSNASSSNTYSNSHIPLYPQTGVPAQHTMPFDHSRQHPPFQTNTPYTPQIRHQHVIPAATLHIDSAPQGMKLRFISVSIQNSFHAHRACRIQQSRS